MQLSASRCNKKVNLPIIAMQGTEAVVMKS